MAPAELPGIYGQKRASAYGRQSVLVLSLCGFSPDPASGAGGGDLLLAGYTGRVREDRRAAFQYDFMAKGVSMMRKIQNLFKDKWFPEWQIPSYVRQEFLQESVRKNDFSLRIICVIIFAAEFYNLLRVVFWSLSGLGTRNNQIYFSMYCILLLLAALWLALRRLLQRAPVRFRLGAQYVVTGLIFLWHVGLNTYDLYRDPAAGTTVLTTALLGLALLIQLPSWYSVVQFVVGYLLFRGIMAPLLDAGDQLNLTITFMVALAVSLANAHHTSVTLKQQKQIVEINTKLQELVNLDPLTGLLNKTTVECWVEQVLLGLEHTGKSGGLTLLLVDLDEFKRINDHYGHPCGDHVLVETAKAMRRTFPDVACLGRIGGDEFAAFYDCPLTEEQAMTLGQGLVEQLGKIQWENHLLDIQCSVGACICTQSQYTYKQLYAETDRVLYQAKEAGKGRCCVRQLTDAEEKQFKEERV
ncbi:GGDEF domain-containing protein [Intestinimonas aquisgranensis]|nr:GGDEF domain-containing protein [Intestinimonas aquisgranensis]